MTSGIVASTTLYPHPDGTYKGFPAEAEAHRMGGLVPTIPAKCFGSDTGREVYPQAAVLLPGL